MIDLRLPKPLHRPDEVAIMDGPILLDLRFYALSGGSLVKRFERAGEKNHVVWWFDQMPTGDRDVVTSRIRKREIPIGPLHVTPGADVDLVAEFADVGFTIRAATPEWCDSNPSGVDWLRQTFPAGLAGLDEFTLRMVQADYEREIEVPIRGLDDARFFPKFASRSLNPERVSTMSEEFARVTALYSPQRTERGAGRVLVVNPSFRVVAGAELKCWYRVDDVVDEHVLTREEAAILDELDESLGGIAVEDLEARFGKAAIDRLSRKGLLLAR